MRKNNLHRYTCGIYYHPLTLEEIQKEINEHDNYIDYCRVWYCNGETDVFYNNLPTFYCYDNYCGSKKRYGIEFTHPILSQNGAFAKLGIVRAKRVVIKKV